MPAWFPSSMSAHVGICVLLPTKSIYVAAKLQVGVYICLLLGCLLFFRPSNLESFLSLTLTSGWISPLFSRPLSQIRIPFYTSPRRTTTHRSTDYAANIANNDTDASPTGRFWRHAGISAVSALVDQVIPCPASYHNPSSLPLSLLLANRN